MARAELGGAAVSGAVNLFADLGGRSSRIEARDSPGMGSHQSARSETDVWLTPPAIVEALGGWESFDLDPCAQPDQAEVLPTARAYYTEADNGLVRPWFGRVWLNSPYSVSLITAFLGRMAAHGCGTALMFARTETDAFFRYVWEEAHGLMFLRGRLNFHRPNGTRTTANGGAPSVLVAYGEDDRDILAAAPIDGQFVALRLRTQLLVTAFAILAPRSGEDADRFGGPGTTWAEALKAVMAAQPGPVSLGDLYRAFLDHPKTRANQHWREKLRQALQRGEYERVEKGVWQRRLDRTGEARPGQSDLVGGAA